MSSPPSDRVFISYRRQESSGWARLLQDRLADRFGDDQVFMDVDTIALGVDFAQVITQAVSTCEVLLAVIGPHWLTATDEDGRRRLEDPDDIVRLEIAAALERDIRVIPILVEGATMPRRQELPDSLGGLARRNALSMRHESFRSDTDQLLAAIDPILRPSAAAPPVAPDLGREFRLGPLHVPVRILEGNGEHAIDESNVRVLVNPVDVQLPDELVEWRAEIAAEQDRRREVGERAAWNGASYAVEDLIIERVGPQEDPAVTLILKHCDYYTFLATQQLDRRLRGGATPRSLYLDGREPHEVPDFMRSCFGQNIAVVTADNWLLVPVRSEQVHTGRGLWNSSANESLSRDKDSIDGAPPNLFMAARRGVREELHLLPHQYELDLLAFHVVTTLCQWGALYLARLRMSKKNLEDHLTRGSEDNWEHKGFDLVLFEPEPVLRYLLHDDRRGKWGPAAPVLFYLSLVHAHGRRKVDETAGYVLHDLS